MAKRILLNRRGDMLLPADSEAVEFIRSLTIGKEYAADILQMRNSALHRKAFAFIKLAFDYWEPENSVCFMEKATVRKMGKFLIDSGIEQSTASTLCKEFLRNLNNQRRGMVFEKDIDAFRDKITIDAGFYKTVITPDGPLRVAKSWAYKNMSEEKFKELFSSIKNVCWELVLSQTFESMQQAEQAAEQMLRFD